MYSLYYNLSYAIKLALSSLSSIYIYMTVRHVMTVKHVIYGHWYKVVACLVMPLHEVKLLCYSIDFRFKSKFYCT